GSYFLLDDALENNLTFLQASYKSEEIEEKYTLKKNLELRVFDPADTDEAVFIDPTDVSLELLLNRTSFQMGFLRYRFSETFGLQILDVANPRDYSDYILNDLS